MRVVELISSSSDANDSINPSFLTLVKLIFTLFLMWHWVACIYYFLAVTVSDGSQGEEMVSVGRWAPYPEQLVTPSVISRYLFALNWAVGVTCQIIIPEPETLGQQVFGITIVISSVIVLALIIGSATTLIADLQSQNSEVSSI